MAPEIFVYQDGEEVGEKYPLGIRYQLEGIVNGYLSMVWSNNASTNVAPLGFDEAIASALRCLPVGPNTTNLAQPPGMANAVSEALAFNLLEDLFNYVQSRLSTLNRHCVICDGLHQFAQELLRPCVCSRDLCTFAFQTLGVAAGAADHVAASPQVVNLLIAMCRAAALSTREDKIFEPFPVLFEGERLLLHGENQRDVKFCIKLLESMPSMEDPAASQRLLETPLCRDLLWWITSSNRSHLAVIQQPIPSLAVFQQFILLSAAPEKEARFRELKAEHGSVCAFHGSPFEVCSCPAPNCS